MTLIDPRTERERGPLEPPFWPVWLSTFEACHLLAFGTHWRVWDYRDELEARLAADELLPFECEAPFYNTLVRELSRGTASDDSLCEAVGHYLSSRGLSIALQQASQLLAEAAARGQVVARGRRSPDAPLEQMAAYEWTERERYRFSRNHLYQRDQVPMVTKEWCAISFFAEDVEALRSNGLTPPERPSPISAEVIPLVAAAPSVKAIPEGPGTLKAFQTEPSNLRAVCERLADRPYFSRPDMAEVMSDLFREAGGHQRAADKVGSIIKTWKQQGLSRDALVALAGH